MGNKELYEAPTAEVIGVNLNAIVCTSDQETSVQTVTDYEFTEEEW